jgi:putative ABC transport system permease protein
MAIFVVLALTLASVGLYGVLSFAVGQRTREVGVRVVLGAGAGRIGHLILKGGMRMALLGVVLGVLLSLWASRVLESLLFQTSATDVVTLVAAASLMLCVAALASWIPAGRAARLDPVQALKTE